MAWDNTAAKRNEREIEQVKRELHWCDLAATLITDPVFNEWFEERFMKTAKGMALTSIERPQSNADRHAASGILRFVRGKKGELSKYSSQKYRQDLEKRLEVLYGERERRGATGARGRSTELPFGAF